MSKAAGRETGRKSVRTGLRSRLTARSSRLSPAESFCRVVVLRLRAEVSRELRLPVGPSDVHTGNGTTSFELLEEVEPVPTVPVLEQRS
jgi:hypothetical protein